MSRSSFDFSSYLAEPLSSFSPCLGRNVFFDYTNESTKLYVILKLSETLSFVGTVALTVLQGSISVFGSIIPPSSIRHQIYAPKNYPIATMESIEYFKRSSVNPTLPTFMKELVTESDAILEIEDLHSGVQGLYQVCPVHLAIFEVPIETGFDFKLRQFFPVCSPHSLWVSSDTDRRFYTAAALMIHSQYLLHGPAHCHRRIHGRKSA
jgi:hypothetical protein